MDHVNPTLLAYATRVAQAIGYALFARATGLDVIGVRFPIAVWLRFVLQSARLGLGRAVQRLAPAVRGQERLALAARSLATAGAAH